MKRLIRNFFNIFGYEIRSIHRKNFSINGIQYETDPYSVGKTPQGQMTAEGAVRMIKERNLKNLKILDICCGTGIVGLTVYSMLKDNSIIEDMAFGDINIFNIFSVKKTLSLNKLNNISNNMFRQFLTDGLQNIPDDEKFDIIISNPPHFLSVDPTQDNNACSPIRLGTNDANWAFHKSFYSDCHEYLSDNGEVWFLENGSGANESDLLPYIKANDQLRYVKMIKEELDMRFFWMISEKA